MQVRLEVSYIACGIALGCRGLAAGLSSAAAAAGACPSIAILIRILVICCGMLLGNVRPQSIILHGHKIVMDCAGALTMINGPSKKQVDLCISQGWASTRAMSCRNDSVCTKLHQT